MIEQFIIIKSTIEANKQYMKSNKKDSDEKMIKLIEDFKAIPAPTITPMMDHINIPKFSTDQRD